MKYFSEDCPELSKKIDLFFHILAQCNDQYYSGKLSIILLGSLSREEASWFNDNGCFCLLSDIEFFVVHPCSIKNFEILEKTAKEAEREIFATESKLFHIDYGYVSIDSMKNMERKLLIFDAIQMGKIVVGDNVLENFPKTTIDNINYEDIKDILIHRTFSALYYGKDLKYTKRIEEYRYNIAKNTLDLMTVVLALNGILVSGFGNKLQLIMQQNLPDHIKEYFSYCLDVKLGKNTSIEMSINQMEILFINLVECLNKDFVIPYKNYFTNFKFIFRRRCGIVKRMINSKTMTLGRKKYLDKLIKCFKEDKSLDLQMLRENYVLNGYPLI